MPANDPAERPKPKAKPKPKPVEGIERGDHVYVNHPKLGAMAVRVLASGKDGFTGECDKGQRHGLPWETYLGHKARMLQRYDVVDQGADGALLQDDQGRRRFLAGEVPVAKAPSPEPTRATDDPILGGMDRLKKSQSAPRSLYLSRPVKNGADIAKWYRDQGCTKVVTPDDMHVTIAYSKQPVDWDSIGDHFDEVHLRSNGDGRSTEAFGDGATVLKLGQDEGNELRQRWADVRSKGADWTWPDYKPHVTVSYGGAGFDKAKPYPGPIHLGPERFAEVQDDWKPKMSKASALDGARVLFMKAGQIANKPGLALKESTDKAGRHAKHWVKTQKDQPKERPKASETTTGTEAPEGKSPMQHGQRVGFRHQDVAGEGTIVGSGADGATVRSDDGREHQVRHEHLTGPVEAEKPAATAAGGAEPKPLFDEAKVKDLPTKAAQPIKSEEELYAKAPEALEHLHEWLDRDKGICAQLGFETAKGGMDGVDWEKPGGMLFIGKVKGRQRAAEKVASDYGGDWSQLLDPVRCSIAVDKYDDVQSVIAALEKGGMKLSRQPKDRFAKPLPAGYRDLMLNVTLPNGLIGEVQVHVKPMLKAKDEGHHYYEIERSLVPKGEENWTPEETQAVKDAQAKQTEIYGKAWQSSVGGGMSASDGAGSKAREQQPMAKALEAMTPEGDAFDFLEHDNAYFRRKQGKVSRAVDDVLLNGKWSPYKGDRLQAGAFGDMIDDPLGKGDGGAPDPDKGEKPLEKALPILFIKAQIKGGASGDLFQEMIHVDPHVRAGKMVAAYDTTRMKKIEPVATPKAEPAAPVIYSHAQWSVFGGYHAIGNDGHPIKRHDAKYGDMPPRFATEAKAEEFGRKAEKRAAKTEPAPAPVKASDAPPDRLRRLAALQGRATKHEAVVEHADGRKHLLAYVEGKSGSALGRAIRGRAEHLQRATGAGPDMHATYETKDRVRLHGPNGEHYGHVTWSGRTQRDAIMDGEHIYIGGAEAPTLAAPPAPVEPPAGSPVVVSPHPKPGDGGLKRDKKYDA